MCDIESAQLLEFPSSLLLNAGVTAGSIVNIICTRDDQAERARDDAFWSLVRSMRSSELRQSARRHHEPVRRAHARHAAAQRSQCHAGASVPSPAALSLQTSVTLEWARLELATATLVDLAIYRNGVRLASIPSPTWVALVRHC